MRRTGAERQCDEFIFRIQVTSVSRNGREGAHSLAKTRILLDLCECAGRSAKSAAKIKRKDIVATMRGRFARFPFDNYTLRRSGLVT